MMNEHKNQCNNFNGVTNEDEEAKELNQKDEDRMENFYECKVHPS